jgi:sodium pump decarboxylase gamma subunit
VGDFVQGLYVTVVGMALVFASLGLLMLIMVGLERLLRARPVQAAEEAKDVRAEEAVDAAAEFADAQQATEAEQVAAAISTAIAYWRQRDRQAAPPPNTTVISFTPGSSAWRVLGRLS